MPSPVRVTIDALRIRQRARAAGVAVAWTTDPAWLVQQAINRRGGYVEERHARGSCLPVNGRMPRKATGDAQRHLRFIASAVNSPRRVVRWGELGEWGPWIGDRIAHRLSDD